jgi:hypothetical protein
MSIQIGWDYYKNNYTCIIIFYGKYLYKYWGYLLNIEITILNDII